MSSTVPVNNYVAFNESLFSFRKMPIFFIKMKSLSRSALFGSEMLQLCVIGLNTFEALFIRLAVLNSKVGFCKPNLCWATKAPRRSLKVQGFGVRLQNLLRNETGCYLEAHSVVPWMVPWSAARIQENKSWGFPVSLTSSSIPWASIASPKLTISLEVKVWVAAPAASLSPTVLQWGN